jgi:UDP-glucose 4-epimerase
MNVLVVGGAGFIGSHMVRHLTSRGFTDTVVERMLPNPAGHGLDSVALRCSVLEVIESCRRVNGVPIRYKMAPRREGDQASLVADSRAAQRDLGWKPAYTELDRIAETVWRWFSEQAAG